MREVAFPERRRCDGVGFVREAIRPNLTQPRSLLPALPQKGRGLRFDRDPMPKRPNGKLARIPYFFVRRAPP